MSITEAGQGPLFPSLSKNLKYKTQINSNWNYFIFGGDPVMFVVEEAVFV